ncbi:prophage tail fiber N-terminal domain-containing protein, partial [Escherichia coli]|uniref:prophage tail fiber N-terminal domain-containing protein n=1 Tax=Escherichia coli TaxID=562 RepID=UPI001CC4A273
MTVKISGVLKDGTGKPVQNCTIVLKARRTSSTVVVNTVASENPDEAGRYSMDVEYGQYSVTLLVEDFPPSHAGTITVYEGSRPGTLNDFLGAMTEDDVMPEALRRFELMVNEVARHAGASSQSAAAAKKSETAAASSKNAAKTSETNAANSAQAAAASQTASANSATAAKKSETSAKNSETATKASEKNAKSSQTAAKTSETNAKDSEANAKVSETAAANSAKASAASQTAAKAGGVDTSGDEKHVTISCRVKSEVDNIAVRILFEHYDGEVRTSIGAANLNLTTRIISKTGQTSRVTARSVKDDATGWIFFEATLKADTTENTVGGFVQYSPDTGQMVTSGDYLDVTTPQIEAGTGASSFIVTGTAPATRASDMVTVPIKNNLYNLPFTVLCEVHKNWYKTPNVAPRVFDTGGHQTGAGIVMGFGSSGGYDGFPYCDIGGSDRRINENAGLEKMLIGMRVKSERST